MALPQYKYAGLVGTTALAVAACILAVRWQLSQAEPAAGSGLPSDPVPYVYVKSQPEAQVMYPGSRVVVPFGGAEQPRPEGGANSAFAGAVYTSSDGAEAIYGWYAAWLSGRGWTPAHFHLASSFRSIQGYERGTREALYVAMLEPSLASVTLGRVVPKNATLFEVRYLIAPAGG